MRPGKPLTRRGVLRTMASAPALLLPWPAALPAANAQTRVPAILGATPVPLESVRLTASLFLSAVEANRRYLLELEPDRLLHNFRTNAGLKPKGGIYGGWESESLAGHTLGHYLSACSLMYADRGARVQTARRVHRRGARGVPGGKRRRLRVRLHAQERR